MNLTYRHGNIEGDGDIEDLQLNECEVRRAGLDGRSWLMLWFRVARETDGVVEDYAVAIAPGGSYTESGPGGRTWGLTRTAPGVWQVSPSINVLADSRDIHAGPHPSASAWHQTPAIVGVSSPAPWERA